MSPDNCLTAQTCVPETDSNLESDFVIICPSSTAQEKVPFIHTSPHGSGASTSLESDGRTCAEVQQLETQVGQQRAVIEHQEELADATTNESSTDSS